MARRVFFSFHYQNDIWRVNQVRNAGEFAKVDGSDTFYDHSLWEETKRRGDGALRTLIDDGLINSSVTTVLAGSETWTRRWVRYELIRSFERGNGLITLWIDQVKNQFGETCSRGRDPLQTIHFATDRGGDSATVQYFDGRSWQTYGQISTARIAPAAKKAFRGYLSEFAARYAWQSRSAADFASLVEVAAVTAGR